MSDLIRFDFGGRPLTVVMHKGEIHYIARELGAVLEYSSDGARLSRRITSEWSDEFSEGKHFTVLRGDDLADIKRLGPDSGPSPVDPRSPSLMLLTESGLDMVLIKTDKEIGKRLRAFVVDVVFPKLRSGETIAPAQWDGRSNEVQVSRESVLLERERRLQAQQTAKHIKRIAELARRNGVAERAASSWEMTNLGRIGQLDVARMLPHEPEPEWLTPTEIGTKLGVSLNAVGRAISRVPEIAARGNIPGLCRAVVNTAPGHGRTVTSYLYSPRAVELIGCQLGISAPA